MISKRISVVRCFSCACMHTNPVANSISIERLLQEQQQELWRSSSLHPSRAHLQTSHVALCYPVEKCSHPLLFHEKRNCVMEKNDSLSFTRQKRAYLNVTINAGIT